MSQKVQRLLEGLIDEHGTQEIARLCEVCQETVRNWKRNGYVPPGRRYQIATLFGVDVRQLRGRRQP